MAFRIRKPSQESFFALNAIPLYSYAIPLVLTGRGDTQRPPREKRAYCSVRTQSEIPGASLR